MTRKDVERAERFFAGRGAWSVAVARVIPLVRAFTGLVAGFMEVPVLPFEIFNLIGTLVWATVLSVIGYEFGSDWTKVSKNFSHASDALAVLVLLLLIGLIVHKAIEIRKERQADAAAGGARRPACRKKGRTAGPPTQRRRPHRPARPRPAGLTVTVGRAASPERPVEPGYGSANQGLINHLTQLGSDRVCARRHQLGEERCGHLLGRVHPEGRRGGAAPVELPGRAQ